MKGSQHYQIPSSAKTFQNWSIIFLYFTEDLCRNVLQPGDHPTDAWRNWKESKTSGKLHFPLFRSLILKFWRFLGQKIIQIDFDNNFVIISVKTRGKYILHKKMFNFQRAEFTTIIFFVICWRNLCFFEKIFQIIFFRIIIFKVKALNTILKFVCK